LVNLVSREDAIRNLRHYIGQNLFFLAEQKGITVFKGGKQNKGWKGHILELLAGLQPSPAKQPNGITYEPLAKVSLGLIY
jgi:DNA mismatch repair protein MutH